MEGTNRVRKALFLPSLGISLCFLSLQPIISIMIVQFSAVSVCGVFCGSHASFGEVIASAMPQYEINVRSVLR